MKTLLIDNHDSFTYNLFHLLASVNGEVPIVVKNDANWEEVRRLEFDNIVLSPGPGRPDRERDFGISRQAILEARHPILGVCLGHQGIGMHFGAKLIPAPELMHGRQSWIRHSGESLFAGIPTPFQAVRYHSWALDPALPSSLMGLAWTEDGTLMALKHKELPLFGVQFHPESIESRYGRELLGNFKDLSKPFKKSGTVGTTNTPSEWKFNSSQGLSAAPRQPWSIRSRKLDLVPDAERLFVEHFAHAETAFWLDSSRVMPGLSRFSFLGDFAGPHAHWLGTHPLDEIAQRILNTTVTGAALPFDFSGGFVGYLGYELDIETRPSARHHSPLPAAKLGFVSRFVALDHLEQKTYLVELVPEDSVQISPWLDQMEARVLEASKAGRLPEPASPPHTDLNFRLRTSKEDYLGAIQECLQAIRLGESYGICLTNQILAEAHVEPLLVYRFLRSLNPAPYGAYLKLPGFHVLSSSPERFVKADAQGHLEAKPIKGTLPRGQTPQQDEALRVELSSDEKFRSENLMIVDLLRNDLGSVAEAGSVSVPKLMDVETYATVHQLVSTIQAQLASGLTAADAVRAAFPGGSMTGAPKQRTLEIIDRLEQGPRGVYSGALGFFGLNGACDLSIVIRTLIEAGGQWSIGTGGAILALSDPEAEFDETLLKARAPMEALALAHTGKKQIRIT